MGTRRLDRRREPRLIDDCDGPTPGISCVCKTAVVRAFHEMLLSGASRSAALQVAARVYNCHHPGHPATHVEQLVERLVSRTALH